MMQTFDEYLQSYSEAKNANAKIQRIAAYLAQPRVQIYLFEHLYEDADIETIDEDIVLAVKKYHQRFDNKPSYYFTQSESKEFVDELTDTINKFHVTISQHGFYLKMFGSRLFIIKNPQ